MRKLTREEVQVLISQPSFNIVDCTIDIEGIADVLLYKNKPYIVITDSSYYYLLLIPTYGLPSTDSDDIYFSIIDDSRVVFGDGGARVWWIISSLFYELTLLEVTTGGLKSI